MGEIMKNAKNDPSLGNTVNKRKFALLGDPALKISYPKHNIQTNSVFLVDNNSIKGENNILTDTINALSKVKVFGQVKDGINNGVLYVTVFGKSNVFIIFSIFSSLMILFKLIFTVVILSGLFLAISSILTPPTALEINAIFEVDLSIKQDK